MFVPASIFTVLDLVPSVFVSPTVFVVTDAISKVASFEEPPCTIVITSPIEYPVGEPPNASITVTSPATAVILTSKPDPDEDDVPTPVAVVYPVDPVLDQLLDDAGVPVFEKLKSQSAPNGSEKAPVAL